MMKLNTPGRIGNVMLRNRIVMAPMISNLCTPDGYTNEEHIRYLEERAKGGAGLIITEYAYVDINGRGSRNQLSMCDSNAIPKLRRLTERIHQYGCSVFVQLVHAGGKSLIHPSQRYPKAPSSVPYMGHLPIELSTAEISEIVEKFAGSAEIARRANFDGIELHGAHGYLIHEFLSPALNRRDDKYGGSFENRLRFAQEVADAVREESGLPVGIRLSLYEDDADGYQPEYGLKVAESLKGIDYAHFSAGRFDPPGSSMSFYGPRTHVALKLPRKPAVTSIVVGSVLDAADAEAVLEKADFVSVARGMLADPAFAIRAMRGEMPRPCIRCNQACRDNSYGEVRCTVNPETGLESVQLPLERSREEIVIVGAGVKGLEAALMAAKAGMKVAIYEQKERIGGQLLEYRDEKKKEAFSMLIEYYEHELKRLGIEVHLGEKYSGRGLYCMPDRVYDSLPEKESIYIDSNIFQHHDEALHLAKQYSVFMSERSLRSLDRTRQVEYRRIAEERGIRFVAMDGNRFDVSIHEARQYDIRAAMVSGRNALRAYLEQSAE